MAEAEEWEKKMVREPELEIESEPEIEQGGENEEYLEEREVPVQKPSRRHSAMIMKHGLELLEEPEEVRKDPQRYKDTPSLFTLLQ
jgi:hypothetical protein